jgi:hypothetical protein
MTFEAEVLLYLLVCRTLIVSAGITSLVIGYKLLSREPGPESPLVEDGTPAETKTSTIKTSILGARISITNAAPGTSFALFGVLLILIMVIQSSPSVSIETLRKAQPESGGPQPQNTVEEKISMRGSGQDSISLLTASGKDLEAKGDTAGAERAYREAVTTVAEPVNDLAWLYLGNGRVKDAVGLANLAVQLRPDEPRYVDTLEKVKAASLQQFKK